MPDTTQLDPTTQAILESPEKITAGSSTPTESWSSGGGAPSPLWTGGGAESGVWDMLSPPRIDPSPTGIPCDTFGGWNPYLNNVD